MSTGHAVECTCSECTARRLASGGRVYVAASGDRVYVATAVYCDPAVATIESIEPSVFVTREAAERCAGLLSDADEGAVVVEVSEVTVVAEPNVWPAEPDGRAGRADRRDPRISDLVQSLVGVIDELVGYFTAPVPGVVDRLSALRARLVGD